MKSTRAYACHSVMRDYVHTGRQTSQMQSPPNLLVRKNRKFIKISNYVVVFFPQWAVYTVYDNASMFEEQMLFRLNI